MCPWDDTPGGGLRHAAPLRFSRRSHVNTLSRSPASRSAMFKLMSRLYAQASAIRQPRGCSRHYRINLPEPWRVE